MADVRITNPDGTTAEADLVFASRSYLSDLNDAGHAHICGGVPTAEALAELEDFARWLCLPRPRPEFRAWRMAAPPGANETP